MSSLPFTYVIGLEVHVELATNTKMFCRCANAPFGAEPNINTCPVCLGMPGTLPVPNREAVRKTIMVGKAIGSEIPQLAKFDRKHYFYPDNPKGYQISQYQQPFCVGGSLELLAADGSVESTIRFERAHLEEDAGKLLHGGKVGYSRVDLNRAGVPLLEMVTKPDMTSPSQARRFMQEVQQLVRAIGVSEGDMEKGQMRCDVNISIKFNHEGQEVWTPVTEIKNVNSTRAVERSLIAEGQRLYTEWCAGGSVRTRTNKITAGWDEDAGAVNVQRAKEGASDYRYFPEPDIPPIMVYQTEDLQPDAITLPELPNQRRRRYISLGIAWADAEVILMDPVRLAKLDELLVDKASAVDVAKWLVNMPGSEVLPSALFKEMLAIVASGEVAFSSLKPVLASISAEIGDGSLHDLLQTKGLLQAHDSVVVQSAIDAVLSENPQAIQDWKDGKERILGFVVGQVMKRTAGKAQPQKVQEAVKAALTSKI